MASFSDQGEYDVRCEWGPGGVEALAACRTLIIVDVLSFSTCVAIAVEAGAAILPCAADADGAALARSRGALLAGRRGEGGYSLSPASFLAVPPGTRVVLPSPNGAALSLAASRHSSVLAGCLRNRAATCARARRLGGPVGVIAAGERWPDGSLRPALEDLVGAGAIVDGLPGSRSPEAALAAAAFASVAGRLEQALAECASGRELVGKGFPEDVALAAALDAGAAAAELADGAFSARPEAQPDTHRC
jgi:2-phosphosulfolactate phosphatase